MRIREVPNAQLECTQSQPTFRGSVPNSHSIIRLHPLFGLSSQNSTSALNSRTGCFIHIGAGIMEYLRILTNMQRKIF